MTKTRQRSRFDLADALARHLECSADLLEGPRLSVLEAVAHLDHLALAIAELAEELADVGVQQRPDGRLHRLVGVHVLDEIAEAGVLLLAHGGLEGYGVEAHPQDLGYPVG